MRGDIVQFCCLYTKHKTQKRKTWIDGRLEVDKKTNQVYLHDANPPPGSLDAPLDQSELSKTETINIIERNENVLESEKYLVTIEGPWINHERNKSRTVDSKTNFSNATPKISAGMQKLMTRKFRKPSAYIPPPNDQKKRKVINRKPPLQPGDIDKLYYRKQKRINNRLKEPQTDLLAPSLQKKRFQQQNRAQNENMPNLFVEDCNDLNSITLNKISEIKTNEINDKRKKFRDAPEYNSLSYYGEETYTDDDSDSECESFGKNSRHSDSKTSNSVSRVYSGRGVSRSQMQQMQPYASMLSNSCTLEKNQIEKWYDDDSDKVDSAITEKNLYTNRTKPDNQNNKSSTLSKSDLLAMFGAKSHLPSSINHTNSEHDHDLKSSYTNLKNSNENNEVLQEKRSIQSLNSYGARSNISEENKKNLKNTDEIYSTKQLALNKSDICKNINEVSSKLVNPVQFRLLSSSGESTDESSETSSSSSDN